MHDFLEEGNTVAVKILIVDDFEEWRLRLRSFLGLIPGFRVVAEAANGLDAIDKATRLLPDIVLLDIRMPLLDGIEAARRIVRVSPKSGIIFLTQDDDDDIRAAALDTGAAAFLLKSAFTCELQQTIQSTVLNTSPFLSRTSTYPSDARQEGIRDQR